MEQMVDLFRTNGRTAVVIADKADQSVPLDVTENSQNLEPLTEHIKRVLNRPSIISDTETNLLPQVEANNDLGLPPFKEETIKAIQKHFRRKALEPDVIAAGIYKRGDS
ncbi:unnamed protein product [Schistocephalus solidus]|uniref:Sigma-54 factor interaction domain-containing protein n=1 Tax=Schistocephalus solidus TaxID=70667 RepID=A0A183SK68_SCHSO|nr:unnamed protein product [Schistocephalus solidus]